MRPRFETLLRYPLVATSSESEKCHWGKVSSSESLWTLGSVRKLRRHVAETPKKIVSFYLIVLNPVLYSVEKYSFRKKLLSRDVKYPTQNISAVVMFLCGFSLRPCLRGCGVIPFAVMYCSQWCQARISVSGCCVCVMQGV